MHAFQHSLAHRAQPATRSLRWQPYNSCTPIPGAPQAVPGIVLHNIHPQSRSPQLKLSYPTPATQPNSPIESFHHKQHFSAPTIPSAPIKGTTLAHESAPSSSSLGKDAISAQKRHLADQAVSSLCDIWRSQDIPLAFLISSTPPASNASCHQARHPLRMEACSQLPSPAPSSHGTPPTTSASSACNKGSNSVSSESNLVSIKAFVYEVLRRSKTSGCVLQTALCYLEAIRGQVNHLQQREKAGLGSQSEVDQGSKIVQFDDLPEEEKRRIRQLEEEEAAQDAQPPVSPSLSDGAATVRVLDDMELSAPVASFSIPIAGQATQGGSFNGSLAPQVAAMPAQALAPVVPSQPHLPSPLLCPRRAFLAALILATKFSQDRCYSNKAWAKLSGLPPREIGRCERALGQALDWRMWVGKGDTCKSEIATEPPFKAAVDVAASFPSEAGPTRTARRQSGLRKAQSQVFSPVAARPDVHGIPRRHSPPAQPRSSLLRSYTSGHLLTYPIPHVRDSSSPESTTSTPTLVHSPTSTEGSSCGGDQAIHVSNFMDVDRWAKKALAPIAFDPEVVHDSGMLYGPEGGRVYSQVVY